MKFGEWLYKSRKTASQLALEWGVSRTTLWKCANDQPVSPDIAKKIYEGTKHRITLKSIATKKTGRPRHEKPTQGCEE